MKFQHPDSTPVRSQPKTSRPNPVLLWFAQKSTFLQRRFGAQAISSRVVTLNKRSHDFLSDIKSIGIHKRMDEYDRRKLSIFNQLNFFQLVTGIIIPLSWLLSNQKFSISSYLFAGLPAMVSVLVLCLNFYYKHEAGIIVYFTLYPLITGIVYLQGLNLGVELDFILYGILSVFFLQQISHMVFSLSFSMVSYFVLAVVGNAYHVQLAASNPYFYIFNQLTAILLIFYGLFQIKKENNLYQVGILATNKNLQEINLQIEKQKSEIEEKAELLKKQTAELTELNSIKNKLFSVIAHDLKSPIYALRSMFNNIQQYNVPASEIKKMVPGIINDLNSSTGLMENLLQWAKSQMQDGKDHMEVVDLKEIVEEISGYMVLQAESKSIKLTCSGEIFPQVKANKEVVRLVLRNLVSNAIKFTPPHGNVRISVHDRFSGAEIVVEDTGVGMSEEAVEKMLQNTYYTTKGTGSESGSGLGLMLCREFLSRNGGRLHIASVPGKGSTFSFTLPKA